MSWLALLKADRSQHMTMPRALGDFLKKGYSAPVNHFVVLAAVYYPVSWKYHRDNLSRAFLHTEGVAAVAAVMVGYLEVRHCFARGCVNFP